MPSQVVTMTIREALLAEVKAQEPQTPGQSLRQGAILNAAAKKLGSAYDYTVANQQALLTQWNDLFRTGLLAWGLNLTNPNPPFFHVTDRGRQALANLTRDPSNPAGYLRHLASVATVDPVTMSYLSEGLDCYVAGLFKAAAVMIGASAESTMLCLRDATVDRLNVLGRSATGEMKAQKIKTVIDGLGSFFRKQNLKNELSEPFEAYWAGFAQQIRSMRNDAGHPRSVDPVTPDTVHASLLIFPELARLAYSLSKWVARDLI